MNWRDRFASSVSLSPISTPFPTFTDFLFRTTVAEPFLGIRPEDGAIRIAQSLFRCARPSADMRIALASYLERKFTQIKEADFIVSCVEGLLKMVSRGAFPHLSRITGISSRFRIQFIYQTLHIRGAFKRLLNLFQLSATMNMTLHYEKYCHAIYKAMIRNRDVQLEVDKAYLNNPAMTGGCLISLRHSIMEFLEQNLTSTLALSANNLPHYSLDDHPMLHALFDLEAENRFMIDEYQSLATQFHSNRKPDAAYISEYVAKGILVNLELPIKSLQYSYFFPYLHYSSLHDGQGEEVLKLYLDAGFNIDRENPVKPAFNLALADMHPHSTLHRNRVAWFLSQGSDIDRHYGCGARSGTFLEQLVQYRPDLCPLFCSFLIHHGANVTGVLGLPKASDHALIRVMVDVGRPNLNGRDGAGDPLVFTLLAGADLDLCIFKYLVCRGMYVTTANGKGETAGEVARTYAWDRATPEAIKNRIAVYKWLDTAPTPFKAANEPNQTCVGVVEYLKSVYGPGYVGNVVTIESPVATSFDVDSGPISP